MEDTKPKTFVFVLMPFNEVFNDTYELGIKSACKEAGAYCERVDEQIFVENILERVYNQIAKADVIVAEMSGRNPNVFYETGYAHALNKRVILLTQDAEDIPFDLKHYPHIIYGGRISYLKSQLEARIRWCIENPKESLSSVDLNLQVSVAGKLLEGSPEIDTFIDKTFSEYEIKTKIDIHNVTNKVVDPSSYNIALIIPSGFKIGGDISSVSELPDGKRICNLHPNQNIFPDGWHSFEVTLYVKPDNLPDIPIDLGLRLFTELGTTNHHFKLRLYEAG